MTNQELIAAFRRSFELDDEHVIGDRALAFLDEIEKRMCPEPSRKSSQAKRRIGNEEA